MRVSFFVLRAMLFKEMCYQILKFLKKKLTIAVAFLPLILSISAIMLFVDLLYFSHRVFRIDNNS